MFAASSKRARSSMLTVTSLPASAAATSACAIGESANGTVQRQLDGEDVRILGRCADQLHDRAERLVRVLQQKLTLGNGIEDAVGAIQCLRQGRRERRILQVVALHQVVGFHAAGSG